MNPDHQDVMKDLDAKLQKHGALDYRAGLGRYVQVAAISLAVCLIPLAILRSTGVLDDFAAELLVFASIIVCAIATSVIAAKPILRVDAEGITVGGSDRFQWSDISRITAADGDDQALTLTLNDGRDITRKLPGDISSFAAWLRSLKSRAA